MIQLFSVLLRLKKVLSGVQFSKLFSILLYLIANRDKIDDLLDFIWKHIRNESAKP